MNRVNTGMYRVNTDMYNAVKEEDIYKMERYMNAGFDINEVYQQSTGYGSSAECTLLFYAVEQWKYWAVKFLLDRDADVDIPNLRERRHFIVLYLTVLYVLHGGWGQNGIPTNSRKWVTLS